MREDAGEVGRLAVERVAVQQDDGHADRLHRPDETGHQRRVGAVRVQVRVAEADVELQRQARSLATSTAVQSR